MKPLDFSGTEAARLSPELSQRKTITCDVLVVGGGVIGLSAALHVKDANPQLKVILLDAPTRPGVASRAAAGMLAPFAEFDRPGVLFDLCLDSDLYYPEFIDRFDLDRGQTRPLRHDMPILMPACGREAARAGRCEALANEYGESQRLIGEEISAVEPGLELSACPEAVRVPGAMIDPRRLHDAMTRAAKERGVIFHPGEARTSHRDEEHLALVESDQGDCFTFGAVVLASGAWSRTLGTCFDVPLPMTPVKGQIARLGVPEGFLNNIFHSNDIYVAPRAGAGLILGATMEEIGFDAGTQSGAISELIRRAVHYFPDLEHAPLEESWAGFRPRLPDKLPVIGRSLRYRNLFLATGHFRNGILLTPITGKLIADALSGALDERMLAFSPGRLRL